MQDRSLIDYGSKQFWLHPVIRAEAISRLRDSDSWKVTNCEVAEFWIRIVEVFESIDDAIRVLEAYHHYIAANEIEKAAKVFLIEKHDKWQEKYSYLGYSCSRLGILQQVKSLITPIIDYIDSPLSKGKIYSLLGDLNWLTGNLRDAISYNNLSGETLEKVFIHDSVDVHSEVNRGRLICLFNKGLFELHLWELEKARQSFLDVISKVKDLPYLGEDKRYTVGSWYYLALVCSHLNLREEAAYYVEEALQELPKIQNNAWRQGYGTLALGEAFCNLGQDKKAFEMYEILKLYSEKSKNPLLKAICLNGLAKLYRSRNECSTAITLHLEAIDILERIGAKCFLAEVLYQLGLAYQKIDETEGVNTNLQRAFQLFSEMEAPKQMDRVRQSMQNEK